jgi:hypothetical protein
MPGNSKVESHIVTIFITVQWKSLKRLFLSLHHQSHKICCGFWTIQHLSSAGFDRMTGDSELAWGENRGWRSRIPTLALRTGVESIRELKIEKPSLVLRSPGTRRKWALD